MPGFPGFDILDPTANMIRSSRVSINMVDLNGYTKNVTLSNIGAQDLAFGEKTRLAEAIGAASNMGVFSLTETRISERRVADATALDEAYSNPANVLTMHFENDAGRKLSYDIPAPDATLFESDGVTLKPRTDAVVGAIIGELIDASLNVINTSFLPVANFAFNRGVRATRKYSYPSGSRPLPTVGEGAGDTEGPGV